jgi:aminoglycoside phosphotransferase (APT) family kinase protein
LRVLRPSQDPRQIRLEASVQNTLAGLGYPAPRAGFVETDRAPLGGAFMVMAQLEGRPLAQGFDIAVSGGTAGRLLRQLADVPRVAARIAALWGEMHARLHALPVDAIARGLEADGIDTAAIAFDTRLANLAAGIREFGLAELVPVLDWLRSNRPTAAPQLALCHGDFHPLNILASEAGVTGVIDWSGAAIAEPAFDVGSTVANLSTVPLGGPKLLRPVMRGVITLVLRRYLAAYRRLRPIDDGAARYYQVFRCAAHRLGAARHTQAGGRGAGAHHLPGAQALINARIRSLTGIALAAARS